MGGDVGGLLESRELTCLVALREARASFFHDVIAHARSHAEKHGTSITQDDVDLLRSENAYQVAEFYFLIEELNLSNRTKTKSFLRRHNADMQALLEDRPKREMMGLLRQRVEEAIFSEIQIEKVSENIIDGKLRLDQSDLGRLLSTIMSPETCRKVVVSMAKGGLINRINIGQVLVISNGNIERCFRAHLTRMSNGINARHQET